jgi:hypothetical protein
MPNALHNHLESLGIARRLRKGLVKLSHGHEALFQASTVTRAIGWISSPSLENRRAAAAAAEARVRWNTPFYCGNVWGLRTGRDLLDRHLRVSKLTPEAEYKRPWPVLSDKSTLESMNIAAELTNDWMKVYQPQLALERNQTKIKSAYAHCCAEARAHGEPVPPNFDDIAIALEMAGELEHVRQPDEDLGPRQEWDAPEPALVELALRQHSTFNPTSLKAKALHEMGAKTRLVTLHPAWEVWACRRLTQLLLPTLKGNIFTRDILKGQDVSLKRQGDQKSRVSLYSADLSAATDWIPHEVAHSVIRYLINRRFETKAQKERWMRLAEVALGPKHDVDSTNPESFTVRGVHMGLGPSWIVLSLLNVMAGLLAAPKQRHSFAVCGDDMIALWTQSEIETYESVLENWGLKINRSKSFIGPRGVFCEKLVEQHSRILASSRSVGHIAEAGASKWKADKSDNPLAVADALRKPVYGRRLRRLQETTRRRMKPTQTPGPIRAGGSGIGTLPKRALERLIRHGTINLVNFKEVPKWSKEITLNSVTQDEVVRGVYQGQFVRAEDARILLSREQRLVDLASDDHKARNRLTSRPLTRKQLRKTAGMGISTEEHCTRTTMADAIQKAGWNRRHTRQALHILGRSKGRGVGVKTRRLLQSIALSGHSRGWVPIELIEYFANEGACRRNRIESLLKEAQCGALTPRAPAN